MKCNVDALYDKCSIEHYLSNVAAFVICCTGRVVKEQSQATAVSLNATTNEHMAAGDA